MLSTQNSVNLAAVFAENPIMAILRGYGPDRSLQLAQRAWDLGIHLVEIPIQNDDDRVALREVCDAARSQSKIVGAGTVTEQAHVDQAKECGAAFTVSPGFDRTIVRASHAVDLPTIPGVSTPTEIQAGLDEGLDWMKAFPASVLGTAWFKAMHGPFPQVRLLGTGGIDACNASAFLDAGAHAVAVGSALEDESQLPLIAAIIAERREAHGV